MITREISCTYCGREGQIEVPGLPETIPESKLFKHLGHNPWSGDLHYQCPGCRIVLLVKPMDVLDERKSFCYRTHKLGYTNRTLAGLLNVIYESTLMMFI
jgi:hypothetical protein